MYEAAIMYERSPMNDDSYLMGSIYSWSTRQLLLAFEHNFSCRRSWELLHQLEKGSAGIHNNGNREGILTHTEFEDDRTLSGHTVLLCSEISILMFFFTFFIPYARLNNKTIYTR